MQKQEPGPEAAIEGHKPLKAQAHLGLEVWQRAEGRGRSGTGRGGSLGKAVGARGMIREWAGQVSGRVFEHVRGRSEALTQNLH